MNKLSVFILGARNNPVFLQEALDSITRQVGSLPISVILSLNGDGRECTQHINLNRTVKLIVRRRPLTATGHTKQCIMECRSEYIMLFHDDDILVNGYLKRVHRLLEKSDPDLILSDCKFFNSDCKRKDLLQKHTANDHREKTQSISHRQVAGHFLRGSNINFASCVYRHEYIKTVDLDLLRQRFGKYADRPMMLESAGNGQKVFLLQGNTVLTRIHKGQDSQQADPMGVSFRKNLLEYYLELFDTIPTDILFLWPYSCLRSIGKDAPLKALKMTSKAFKGGNKPVLIAGLLIAITRLLAEFSKKYLARTHAQLSSMTINFRKSFSQ